MKKYIKETLKFVLRSRPFTAKYVREIEAMYAMAPEQLRTRNEERFLKIFRKAFDHSPFYHKLYTEAGISREDIRSLDDMKRLPVVTKEMIKKHGAEMVTTPKWKLLKNYTSGTTGSPLIVYEDWQSIWREQAYFECYRRRCGYRYGEPMVSLRGNLTKEDPPLKVHVSNTLYLSSYNINASTIEQYHRLITHHQPVAIEGYPSSLYALALQLKDAGLRLKIPVAFTSSETLLDYQRSLIEKMLGTQVYDHYGTTERTIRLSEAIDHSGYFEDPGYSINEYTADGEITTSLINESFPLIRYVGSDLVELNEGDERVKIKRIVGRMEDHIVCKDGSRVTRIDFVEEGSHIKATQWIQEHPGQLTVKIVPDDGFTEADKQFVVEETLKRVGKGNIDLSVELVSMDGLEYTPSGKQRTVMSKVKKKIKEK